MHFLLIFILTFTPSKKSEHETGISLSKISERLTSVLSSQVVRYLWIGNGNVGKAFCFLDMPTEIKIPRSLSSVIAADNRLLKPMSVFYALKSFYVGGSIHNFRARYSEIATALSISPSKLRTEVKRLLELEIVWFNESKELRLASNKSIIELFGTSTLKKDYLKFQPIKELEYNIKAVSINDSLSHQRYVLGEKILKKNVHTSKLKAGAKEAVISQYLREEAARGDWSRKIGLQPKMNTDVTLSRKGIAARFGRTSKSTGSRIAKRLKKLTFLKERQNLVFIKCSNPKEVYDTKIANNTPNLIYKNGAMYLQLANILTITAFKEGCIICN